MGESAGVRESLQECGRVYGSAGESGGVREVLRECRRVCGSAGESTGVLQVSKVVYLIKLIIGLSHLSSQV